MKQRQNLYAKLWRESTYSTKILTVAAVISLTFGFAGWYGLRNELGLNLGDIIYRSLAALTLAVPYHSAENWNYDWRIEIARWAGMTALVIGAAKALLALFQHHRRERKLRRRHNHWLVIGSNAFAEQLCQSAKSDGHIVHWLCAPSGQIDSKHLYTDHQSWSLANAQAHGIENAAGIVVATDDDAINAAIAREIRSEYHDVNQLTIMARIQSPWLALRLDEQEGVAGVTVFSEAQMAVRRQQRQQPAFLVANKLGQRRLHIVIVDFNDYGEAVLVETLLSSLTTDLGKPLFTIVDPRANAIKQDLENRYPELHESADMAFIEGTISSSELVLNRTQILVISDPAPVSVYYCCHNNDELSLETSIALQSITQFAAGNGAPIATRLSIEFGSANVAPGVKGLKPGNLISFGSLSGLATDSGLFSSNTDVLARVFHEAYVESADDNKTAKTDWVNLSEDMKQANRSLVVHIPAKLHSMGIDIEPWLRKINRIHSKNKIHFPNITGLSDNTERVEPLAILEHERWMAERRLNGWIFGQSRDNQRRVHPDLVPYAQLSEDSKKYDRTMVMTLARMLERK